MCYYDNLLADMVAYAETLLNKGITELALEFTPTCVKIVSAGERVFMYADYCLPADLEWEERADLETAVSEAFASVCGLSYTDESYDIFTKNNP